MSKCSAHHYDPYAQALAKIERGHARDLNDARELVARGLVDVAALSARFQEFAPK